MGGEGATCGVCVGGSCKARRARARLPAQWLFSNELVGVRGRCASEQVRFRARARASAVMAQCVCERNVNRAQPRAHSMHTRGAAGGGSTGNQTDCVNTAAFRLYPTVMCQWLSDPGAASCCPSGDRVTTRRQRCPLKSRQRPQWQQRSAAGARTPQRRQPAARFCARRSRRSHTAAAAASAGCAAPRRRHTGSSVAQRPCGRGAQAWRGV